MVASRTNDQFRRNKKNPKNHTETTQLFKNIKSRTKGSHPSPQAKLYSYKIMIYQNFTKNG